MKRYFCFFLAVLITAMSIILYCPFNIYANDAFTISKNSTEKTGLTADEAQKAIDANADIKGKDGVTMLLYTPSDSYNYTLKSGAFVAHLSDSQAKAMLMSKKSFQQYVVLCSSLISNGTVFRGFLKTVGIATTGDSDALTNIVDKFTCNYNYLDSINYDEDTQTIVMSNDNSAVDKLREEIKKYYYIENGMFYYKPYGSFSNVVSTSFYSDMTLYQEDYNLLQNYDYAFKTSNYILAFNKSDFNSFYFTGSYNSFNSGGSNCLIQFVDNDFNAIDLNFNSNFNYVSDAYSAYSYHSVGFHSSGYNSHYWIKDSLTHSASWGGSDSFVYYFNTDNGNHGWQYGAFYSKDNSDLLGFVSYEALYNYFHGDKNAYLSSRIDKAGEDISFSIKDMNENLGSKMDTLIDSINDKKGSMSADELQNAIDKGLEDLNKNTEDIKDNTQEMNGKLDSILEALNAQNQTLLAILGVTKKLADTVDDIDEKTDYNSIISTISTIFNAVQCALLYGQNTLKDSDSSSQAQSVSYSDDDIAVYSDSGGAYKPKVLNMDLRSGIFGHFPFSMIYHMYNWCAAFVAEAKAPVFTYNYGFLVGDKNNPELTVSIDLSQYEDWRDVAASFMRLSFTLAVAFGSYKRFKEEML